MSQERKQDLINNEHERVQEALHDLASFVRKHGCLPLFRESLAVHLCFNTSEEAIARLAESIGQQWSYEMISGLSKSAFLSGASESVQERLDLQNRINDVALVLGPEVVLLFMAHMADGGDPNQLLKELEEKADKIRANQEEANDNPLLKLDSFAHLQSPPQTEEEVLGQLFDHDSDDDDFDIDYEDNEDIDVDFD